MKQQVSTWITNIAIIVFIIAFTIGTPFKTFLVGMATFAMIVMYILGYSVLAILPPANVLWLNALLIKANLKKPIEK